MRVEQKIVLEESMSFVSVYEMSTNDDLGSSKLTKSDRSNPHGVCDTPLTPDYTLVVL